MLESIRVRLDELYVSEGDRAGAEFKQESGAGRLANLVNKGEVFREVFADEQLLKYVQHVLGPEIKLSSVNARRADPHNNSPQPLHADMGATPDERGNWVCNSIWMIDDFTEDNGPIRAIPGSHRWGKLPQDELDDPAATHPDEVLLTGQSGTVIVMNAHVWHGGIANQTAMSRTALHSFYCRRDKPQQQHQKQLLDQHVQEEMDPRQRYLLALDDPRNDELSANVVTRSGFLK